MWIHEELGDLELNETRAYKGKPFLYCYQENYINMHI